MDSNATGVGFTNVLQGDAYLTNAVAHNGSGVAIGDVDGDGWQDIYLCSLQGRIGSTAIWAIGVSKKWISAMRPARSTLDRRDLRGRGWDGTWTCSSTALPRERGSPE